MNPSEKSSDRVNVRQRFIILLNGKILCSENFPWHNVVGQYGGFKEKALAMEFAKNANVLAKSNFVEPREFKITTRHFVYFGTLPVGPMYNYGIGPSTGKGKRKKMMEFPKELLSCPHGFATIEEANVQKRKFAEYLDDCCSVPKSDRSGSAKFL